MKQYIVANEKSIYHNQIGTCVHDESVLINGSPCKFTFITLNMTDGEVRTFEITELKKIFKLAIKRERAESPKIKLVTSLKAGKLRKQLYKK